MATNMLLILASALVGLCLLCQPTEALGSGPEWIVGIHNYYRRLVGLGEGYTAGNMKKMRWDSTLAQEAAGIVTRNHLNNLSESALNIMDVPIQGVNIAIGKGQVNVKRFLYSWFNERKYYDRKYNVCHVGKRCKNYMQLVSAETDRIGCALSTSIPGDPSSVFVFACVYSPGLNTADPIFKVGQRCSLCTMPNTFCELGLCTNCDSHKTDKCECRKTCRSQYGYGVLSKHTCTCHCVYGHGPNCNEQCRNPEQYMDFNICAEVTKDDCRSNDLDMRAMMEEFCPQQCTCRAMPPRD